MAIELATAYVSLVPSFGGGPAAIAQAIVPEVSAAGDKAGKGFADNFKSIAAAGGLIAGGIIGTAVTAGITGSLNAESATSKLSAQLGLTGPESERIGGVAGALYRDAYGENMAEVGDAVSSVMRNIGGMSTASSADLQKITGSVLDVSTAFDQDLGGVTTAVGQLMRTGMAPNAEAALDIITRGLQTSANSADDLLDTFTEYPALFQQLGVDAPTAMGLINQGMAAGARNTDLVADALKEFQIRATEGGEGAATAFESLGFNAQEMTAKIAAGGAGASEGLDQVLDGLRGIEDPVARNAAAVGLFGTQAEDLGAALFALDPTTAVAGLGEVTGAAAKMGSTLNDNTTTAWTALQRQMQGVFIEQIGPQLLPILREGIAMLGQFAPVILPAAAALAVLVGAVYAVNGAMALWKAAQTAAAAATVIWGGIQTAFNAIMAVNPFVLIIIGIGLLVAGIIWAYENVGWFRDGVNAAWQWIQNTTTAVFGAVSSFFTSTWQAMISFGTAVVVGYVSFVVGAWNNVGNFTRSVFSGISSFFSGIWSGMRAFAIAAVTGIASGIVNGFNGAVSFARGLFSGFVGFLAGVWSNLISGVTSMAGNVVSYFSGLPGRIIGGLSSLGGMLLNAGVNAMQGFINGVTSMARRIIDAAVGAIKGGIDAVKNFLGIASPSKLAYGIGRFFGQGYIGGLEAMGPAIAKTYATFAPPIFDGAGLADPFATGSGSVLVAQRAAARREGDTYIIQQVDDPVGTYHAISRRQRGLDT